MDRRTSELIDHRKQNSQLGPGLTHLAEFKNILDGSRRSASCAGDSKIGPFVSRQLLSQQVDAMQEQLRRRDWHS